MPGRPLSIYSGERSNVPFSLAAQEHAKDSSLSGLWKQVWQRALRSISLASACRAACVVLHSILEAGLIRYHDIADDINSIVTAADTSGPAVVIDSSLILMHHILHLRNAALPSASQLTSNHIIRWAFSRWKPGMRAAPCLHELVDLLTPRYSRPKSFAQRILFLSSVPRRPSKPPEVMFWRCRRPTAQERTLIWRSD